MTGLGPKDELGHVRRIMRVMACTMEPSEDPRLISVADRTCAALLSGAGSPASGLVGSLVLWRKLR